MNRDGAVNYIQSKFGVEGERLWLNFPEYIVFRNKNNKKWFAIIMNIEKSKIDLEGKGEIDVINLKCDNILIGSLLRHNGFLPAYHMSKKNWLTVLLDGSVADEELKDLINLSYEIIEKK